MIKLTDNQEEIISLWQEAFGDEREDIVTLWREAFGDTEEEINFFMDKVRDARCILYYVDGKPASMLYLVRCKADGDDSGYIYAACTAKQYRGRGLMTQLIDYCKSICRNICLIPASDSLIDYYSARGFNHKISVDAIQFEQSPAILEYLLEGYQLTVPTALLYRGE